MTKKMYISPELNTQNLSLSDILNGSDVLINGEDLFGDK